MSVFSKEVQEKIRVMGGTWIKAGEFEGNGLKLQIKSVEKAASQYGAADDSKMVELGILEEGELFRYTFLSEEGVERKLDSASMPFFIGMNQANVDAEDWVQITREGKGDKTRYFVEKIEPPKQTPKLKAKPTYDPKDVEGIPF